MSALVGAAMSQGNKAKAKTVIWLIFLLTGLFVAGIFLLIQVYGYILVDIYTQNEGIRSTSVSNLKAYSLVYVLDSVQVLLSGVTKGLGLQDRAQTFSLVSYALVGLPAAYIWAIYLGKGLDGLWYGFGVGLFVITLFYIKLITTTDWDEIILQIQNTIEKQVNEFELQRSRDTPSTGSIPADEESSSDNFRRMSPGALVSETDEEVTLNYRFKKSFSMEILNGSRPRAGSDEDIYKRQQ